MAKTTSTATRMMTINLGDERRLLTLRTILSYEAEVRGLSLGQTLLQLLLDAADLDSYPREVRDEINKIRAERRAEVARRCLRKAKAS